MHDCKVGWWFEVETRGLESLVRLNQHEKYYKYICLEKLGRTYFFIDTVECSTHIYDKKSSLFYITHKWSKKDGYLIHTRLVNRQCERF